jgi:hypothetical protein
MVVATTAGAVSGGSSGLGGIAGIAASLYAKRNYSKDQDLHKSLGEPYESPALPLSYTAW